MKKILFPTEFADHAGHMFRYALELANKYKAELITMNAFGRPEGYSIGDDEAKRARVLDKLQGLARENTPDGYQHIRTRFIAELDYPADAILKVADQQSADLIVMGMTGKTDDANRHLGSNALKVLRAAACPVLAIPASATFHAVKKVVFTSDFEFEDILVINFLNRTFDAEIHVIHVVDKARDMARAERNMAGLQETFGRNERMAFQVIEGRDVEEEIEKYVSRQSPDMLAMTSHRRSLISLLLEGSTSRNLARQTRTPLLVYKYD